MSSAPQDKADSSTSTFRGAEPRDAGPIDVRYAGRTAVGLVREHNEDNFVLANLELADPKPAEQVCEDRVGPGGMLFAVCDGMGGAAAGEVASQMAVDVLLEALRRGGAPGERDGLARRLVSAVQEAGKRIYHEAQKERSKRGMGTTATVAVLLDRILFVAEVGDSRAYLLRQGELKQLTKDQSLVNQLIESGHLTEEEAEAFEHSNIILQALGTSDSVQVDLTFVELRRGDRLMLCSDGLSGLVHDDSIRDALDEVSDPSECTSLLVDYAEGGGGHDNITVIVVDFAGDGLPPPGPGDSFGYMQYPLLPDGSEDEDAEERPAGAGHEPARRPQSGRTNEQYRAASGPAWPWLLAGVAALGVGALFLQLSSAPDAEVQARPTFVEASGVAEDSASTASRDDLMLPGEGEAEERVAEAAEAQESPAAEAEVEVRVHTDVEHARLVVNGDAYGPLVVDESYELKLPPGAYRLEAETDGNVSAVAVVTVRGGEPMDVYLQLPRGAQASDMLQDVFAEEGQDPQAMAPAEALASDAVADAPEEAAADTTPEDAQDNVGSEDMAEVEPAAALLSGDAKPTGTAVAAQRGTAQAAKPRAQAERSVQETKPVASGVTRSNARAAEPRGSSANATPAGATSNRGVQTSATDEEPEPPVFSLSKEPSVPEATVSTDLPANPYPED